MRILLMMIALLAPAFLSGCFHVQLNGSVAEATVSVAPLRDTNDVIAQNETWSPDFWIDLQGAERWESYGTLFQHLFVGISLLEPEGLDTNTLYLVTATGGLDYDSNLDRNLDDTPTPVQGSWHAIVTGARIYEGDIRVSVLTEAVYQYLKHDLANLSDAQLVDALNDVAAQLVPDLNEDGGVDYDDVLSWTRLKDPDAYLGELELINSLSKALLDGASAELIYNSAISVIEKMEIAASVTGSQPINDTGVTFGGEVPSGNNSSCVGETIGQQDCSYGRDTRFNDDSDGHAGFSFTKLDAVGNVLDANESNWSCVQDNVTGLIWEVKTRDGGIHDRDHSYLWGGKTAVEYGSIFYDDWDVLVDGSNDEALCGYSEWRVPTAHELVGLTSFDRSGPAIDTNYFPNAVRTEHWSSTPSAVRTDRAWIVDFLFGGTFDGNRDADVFGGRVRLVYGNLNAPESNTSCISEIPASSPDSHFEVHGDGTVTDSSTGLMWMECSIGQSIDFSCGGAARSHTWQAALQLPESTNSGDGFAGYSDWRLPNIKELYSIVELACESPAINSTIFPGTPSQAEYWSSTAMEFPGENTWTVSFEEGMAEWNDRVIPSQVRLVRGAF